MEYSFLCFLKNCVHLSSVQFIKYLLCSIMFSSTVLRNHICKISLRATSKELKVWYIFIINSFFFLVQIQWVTFFFFSPLLKRAKVTEWIERRYMLILGHLLISSVIFYSVSSHLSFLLVYILSQLLIPLSYQFLCFPIFTILIEKF